jgi:hypothetical protein
MLNGIVFLEERQGICTRKHGVLFIEKMLAEDMGLLAGQQRT